MVEDELRKGPEQLKGEVIASGWCVSCGACVELCPYIKAIEDKVAVAHSCGLNDGNCYTVCPRTATDYRELSEELLPDVLQDDALGDYREVLQVRSGNEKFREEGQYGGVTTALTAFLLKEGTCSMALLTGSDGLSPRWNLVRTEEEVVAAAGSKYGVCPSLTGLNETLRSDLNEKIAVTGRPCQVTALRKMQRYSSVKGREKVGPILGLFCFWGLDYRFYRDLKNKHGIKNILKSDIPKNEGLTLNTDQGEVSFSLEETRSYIRQGCYSCFDPTSELADISIGSTEGDPAWCTVIVRSRTGEELLHRAVKGELLETRPCSEGALSSLKWAVLQKKRRVLAENTAIGTSVNSSYLKVEEEKRRRIMEEGA